MQIVKAKFVLCSSDRIFQVLIISATQFGHIKFCSGQTRRVALRELELTLWAPLLELVSTF